MIMNKQTRETILTVAIYATVRLIEMDAKRMASIMMHSRISDNDLIMRDGPMRRKDPTEIDCMVPIVAETVGVPWVTPEDITGIIERVYDEEFCEIAGLTQIDKRIEMFQKLMPGVYRCYKERAYDPDSVMYHLAVQGLLGEWMSENIPTGLTDFNIWMGTHDEVMQDSIKNGHITSFHAEMELRGKIRTNDIDECRMFRDAWMEPMQISAPNIETDDYYRVIKDEGRKARKMPLKPPVPATDAGLEFDPRIHPH